MRPAVFLLSLLIAVPAIAQSAPLSRERVADYIRTRIATHRLQMRMKANAADYDDVVHAFYDRREDLLADRGWTVEGFEDTQERILAARSAMEREAGLAATRAQDAETVADMRAAGMPEKQIEQMQAAMAKAHEQETRQIDIARPDWPAVRAYGDELDGLTAWIAGNTPNPPSLQ